MAIAMKDKILSYDGSVPRYTSYPTAPHFKEQFSRDTYKEWLNSLPQGASLSLYLHIPFCDEICFYCGCHTKATKQYDPVKDYTDWIVSEIKMLSKEIPSHCHVKHLHFGGGSPTILRPDEFNMIMDTLHDHFTFSDNAEKALEGDPRSMENGKLKAYAAQGINRISLGVQDFDEKVMEAINRVQSYDVVYDCVERMRTHGINKLNMDFIYGLPYQTLEGTEKAMHQALTMQPDRLALFGYAHVPWMKKHMRLIKDETLPDNSLRYDLFQTSAQILTNNGYDAIGIDHFAKKEDEMAVQAREGRLRRNFQGYTTDASDALVGFGVSSISELPQGYVQNQPHNILYKNALSELNAIPVYRGIELTPEDQLRKKVIEHLMCNFAVDLGTICKTYDFPENFLDDNLNELSNLVHDGFVSIEGRNVRITPDAKQLVRIVASAFDSYFKSGTAKHSKAV